uniref:Uncharacterized protein n=2 Tax=unclassified Caudoviricetes TaxID=2788787 RepID=A0A8S5PCW4_9CAUD|nr:MAG TPA: hypothetical protein [Myoviridae sp. ctFPV8]DAF59375.1 MAG TPA: hypothetical protein [Myoviridae sp. ctQQg4]DAN92425.1 MAG TPA: hypothetical protein [Caudoviricetes sp.]
MRPLNGGKTFKRRRKFCISCISYVPHTCAYQV